MDGNLCLPFDNYTLPFRCPSGCSGVKLLNPRTIGDQEINYQPLIVGGPHPGTPATLYRGDSFICAAAQHAGLIGEKGGCGAARMVGVFANYTGSKANGLDSIGFDAEFPATYMFEHVASQHNCADRRRYGYVINVLFLAFVVFVLQPKSIALL